ncbi:MULTISPECIES: SDR family oxidoreductase [Pseudomonas syringae group]|uniref:SDR family oxidoreductase n=1 Tax=Pseudomonas syringae group TaxID=136849 RepID=UPI000CD047F2|nr:MULTISPECIES: SDR family oxidoreductase [Pseudomonas syringae group]MBS7422904.1 SDR family oxidoreductase [Pseudomonas syringae]MBS7434641.1 SDR family oxidoreductase [Pseudomonas syringae]MCF5737157.1 SDR family NAD(P)-dependent oxidoreductase [Pseudomonas syringae]MCF5742687.1 SDR family NAD(P)-dependent oxidoreductase [Pseudomonas syringae]MCF5753044.1 SDR family NAD(P)-dependent oxidoreductase [Pseudomonas syringae]
MMNAQNRLAVVTGASSGIGRATAEKLLEVGIDVIGNARRGDRLVEMEVTATRQGRGKFTGVVGDIGNQTTLDDLMSKCVSEADRTPDIFVINAGKGLAGSILTSDAQKWAELFHLNCISAMWQMKAAAKAMLERSRQSITPEVQDIVVLGSIVGRHLSPGNHIYGATKFALHSLAESLRRELAPHWIRVTLIEPGTVRSEFQEVAGYDLDIVDKQEEEVGPYVSAQDVARLIEFVISQPNNVHFSDLVIRPTRQTYP